MQFCSLSKIRGFHQDVLATVNCGIVDPSDLGFVHRFSKSDHEFALCLHELEVRLERAIAISQENPEAALWNALTLEERVTDKYRAALEIWCRTDGSPLVLELVSAKGLATGMIFSGRWLRFIQPAVWFVLSYVCLLTFWLFLCPSLLRLAADLEYSSWAVSLLTYVDAWGPVWAIGIPLIGFPLLVGCTRWLAKTSWAGPSREGESRVAEVRAELTAAMVTKTGMGGPTTLSRAVELTKLLMPDSPAVQAAASACDSHSTALYGWATEESSPAAKTSEKLSIAKELFRITHLRDLLRSRELSTGFRGVLFGGLLVLGVGLLLFLPVFQLIQHMGSAGVKP